MANTTQKVQLATVSSAQEDSTYKMLAERISESDNCELEQLINYASDEHGGKRPVTKLVNSYHDFVKSRIREALDLRSSSEAAQIRRAMRMNSDNPNASRDELSQALVNGLEKTDENIGIHAATQIV